MVSIMCNVQLKARGSLDICRLQPGDEHPSTFRCTCPSFPHRACQQDRREPCLHSSALGSRSTNRLHLDLSSHVQRRGGTKILPCARATKICSVILVLLRCVARIDARASQPLRTCALLDGRGAVVLSLSRISAHSSRVPAPTADFVSPSCPSSPHAPTDRSTASPSPDTPAAPASSKPPPPPHSRPSPQPPRTQRGSRPSPASPRPPSSR